MSEANNWRTMESAPKDGTWIELYCPPLADGFGIRRTHVFAKWHVSEDDCASFCWPDDIYEVVSEHGRRAADEEIDDGNCYENSTAWTYWRSISLPAPPQEGR